MQIEINKTYWYVHKGTNSIRRCKVIDIDVFGTIKILTRKFVTESSLIEKQDVLSKNLYNSLDEAILRFDDPNYSITIIPTQWQ